MEEIKGTHWTALKALESINDMHGTTLKQISCNLLSDTDDEPSVLNANTTNHSYSKPAAIETLIASKFALIIIYF